MYLAPCLTVTFKLQIVETAQRTSNRGAGRKFIKKKQKRMVGGGVKVKYPEIKEAYIKVNSHHLQDLFKAHE